MSCGESNVAPFRARTNILGWTRGGALLFAARLPLATYVAPSALVEWGTLAALLH